MKKTLILFLLSIGYTNLYAQRLTAGLIVGGAYNHQANKYSKLLIDSHGSYRVYLKNPIRPTIGVFAEYNLLKKWYLGLQVGYLDRAQIAGVIYDKQFRDSLYVRYKYHYVDFMLYAKFKAANHLSLILGFSYRPLLRYTYNIDATSNGYITPQAMESGFKLGAEYQWQKMRIEASYYQPIKPFTVAKEAKFYSSAINLQIKYTLFERK